MGFCNIQGRSSPHFLFLFKNIFEPKAPKKQASLPGYTRGISEERPTPTQKTQRAPGFSEAIGRTQAKGLGKDFSMTATAMGLGKTSIWTTAIKIFIIFYATLNDSAVAISSTSNDELAALSEQLLENDINNAAYLISVNLQGQVPEGNKNDKAPNRLLTVSPSAWDIPTIANLRLLFNNFVPEVSKSENVTSGEKAEESSFLDAIIATPIMEKTLNFLANKGYISYDQQSFREMLHDLWFGLYPRGNGQLGSSGIEHVFLGELKNGKVSGFHNWIFFNNEELQKQADYLGYIKDVRLGSKGHALKLSFKWRNTYKPIGSMFIGTSPELELALYTICYMSRPDKICKLKLGGQSVSIQTYKLSYNGNFFLASAYPAI